MARAFADIAFTPLVQAEQARHGSDEIYQSLLGPDPHGGDALGPREATFLQARDSLFLASVSETGWPYVQHRGGAPGFVRVLDATTIGFAEYAGNKQYISTGNLRHSNRVCLIALDYARRQRLKIWGRAEITEDPGAIAALHQNTDIPAERGLLIRIAAFDWNCPKHIPQLFTETEMADATAALRARIAQLEAQLAAS